MTAPTYIELVNAVRRAHDVLHERRYYERVIRVDDSPALHEPRALVALGVEVADLCRRIGPTPVDPAIEQLRDVLDRWVTDSPRPPDWKTAFATGALPPATPREINGDLLDIADGLRRVCPRCSGPNDHGDECRIEPRASRDPMPTARTWDVEHDR